MAAGPLVFDTNHKSQCRNIPRFIQISSHITSSRTKHETQVTASWAPGVPRMDGVMVAGLTSTVVVDSEAARKPQKREAAERVQILSLGTSWHILARLGTSWHILAPCTMLRAGTVQRYFDVGGAKSSCTPGIFDKKLRSCVAKMLSCRTRPGRSFFGDERLPFEIPKMHCGGLDSDWASHMGYTWKLEGQT